MISAKNKQETFGRLRLLGNTKVLTVSALLVAMSIVLGKMLAFNIGNSIRISFENLPLLMAGIFFGPFVGGAVAACADIVGCIIVGYSINPVITFGAFCLGFFSGLFSMMLFKNNKFLNIAFSIGLARLIGSLTIKSIGMYIYFHTPIQVLALRIPVDIVTGCLEFYIIFTLIKNKAFCRQLEKICKR